MTALARMLLLAVVSIVFVMATAWVVLRAIGPTEPPCVKTVSCRFDDNATMHVCTCRDGEECSKR